MLNYKIFRKLFVGVGLGLGWYVLAINSSDSPHTTVMLNAVLAFLAIICSAIVVVRIRKEKCNPYQNSFIPFVFFSMIHLAGAIAAISSGTTPNDLTDTAIAGDLLKLVIFTIMMVIAFSRFNEHERRLNLRNIIISGIVLSSLSLVLMFASYYYIFTIIPFEGKLLLAILSIVIVVVGFVYISSAILKNKNYTTYVNPEFLIASFVLFSIASIPPVISLYIPGIWWLFSVGIQASAFLFFILATQIPLLTNIGMKINEARGLALGIVLLALIPFNVTIFLEIITDGVLMPNSALYIQSRLASIILSFEFAFFIVLRFRTSPKPSHQPLIALFGIWGIVEVCQLFIHLSPLGTGFQESAVPYLIGSFVSLIALWHLFKWTKDSQGIEYQIIRKVRYIVGALSVAAVIILGVLFQIQLESSIPNLENSPLGASLLLVSNLIALFAVTYLLSNMVRLSKGRLNAEILAIFVAALWIITNILKASYPDWSVGWWAADLIKLFALFLGMGVAGIMYHAAIQYAQKARGRAQLFSDIVIHDIRNYHQAIRLTLDLAEINGSRTSEIYYEIRESLGKAENLVASAERLGRAEKIKESDLFLVDLLENIQTASTIISKSNSNAQVTIHKNIADEVCYVRANELLIDVFLNLIQNGIKHSNNERRIEIEIHESSEKGMRFWETRIIDHGNGIEPERRKHLFQRFMGDAKGMGLGLSVVKALVDTFKGNIGIESRIPEDYTKGTIFIVKFPCAESN